MRRTPIALATAALLVIAVQPAQAAPDTPLGPAPAESSTTTGKALLGKLTVKAESTKHYERSYFGDGFVDANSDCQDTRAEVLIDESLKAVTYTSTRHCTVKTGKWLSWYDDATWTKASDVDIDHVVPLAEVWGSGATTWTHAKRVRYANDLGYSWTLDAVTDNVNQSKGDRDPAEWLPQDHQCKYARHWVAIKYRWRLSIDQDEKDTLSGILTGSCGAMSLTLPKRAT